MRLIFLLPLIFFSCSLDTRQLCGSWQATAFYEGGQSVPTPLDSVKLTLSNSGDYTFRSIGFYNESGRYRVTGNHLFLSETAEQNSKEKAVKVLFLSADSLKLGMQSNGKDQVVFFKRLD